MMNPSQRQSRTSPTFRAVVAALAAAAALAAPGAAQAYTKSFSAGSLIIPAQMEYQTDCGIISAYGLVYTILYKNAALVAAGKKPITVYWIIEPTKLSHHRCDTATSALPDFSKFNDNDGCDLAVQNASGQPVALLQADNTELAPFNVFSTTYDTTKGQTGRTSPTPGTPLDASTKVVKYSGGFWAIDAVDRAAALDLFLNDGIVHLFRDGGKCDSIPVATAGSHHTTVHSARVGFTAPVARMMNVKPPLIALLDGGSVAVLQSYLQNSGLASLPNAGGTVASHGIIYDSLNPILDFISTPTYADGALNMKNPVDPTSNVYQVMWAPHWVVSNQSTFPKDGDPGDDIVGDGKWTHGGDDAVTNAFKNIGSFSDAGNGLFAECASIESFEGSYKEGTLACSGTTQCECADSSATPACSPFGDIQPQSCPAGYTGACGACYQCDAGYTLDASTCGEVKCVANTNQCASGYTYACGRCYSCNTGWTLDASDCNQVVCKKSGTKKAPNTGTLNTGTLRTSPAGACPTGYSSVCVPTAGSIDIPGYDITRFMSTNRFVKNGLGNSFSGPDCTDQYVVGTKYKTGALTGDCLDFHPTTGGPGNIFSQKGNFNYNGTSGHIHQYLPPASVGSYYRPNVLFFATSRNASDATRDGWDFTTARHKDGDPGKGMVVYLAGHSYQNDVAGNRLVLNTMLNLGFSDSGVELARSEPVGYVTWGLDNAGNRIKQAETVFQGTYVQRQPPGPFQDWLNYNAATSKSWRFPYIDGHLRAYNLSSIATVSQDFKSNALWDAASYLPLPANRKLFTALDGSGNLGWRSVDFGFAQTTPATCLSSATDALGAKMCDLSAKLAECGTAGVTAQQLQAGDPTGSMAGKLGMFVQQVRGHCAAHDKTTGASIFVPSDLQCDDIKSQKNRAKLGGVDHSSPAVVGPTPYIGDERVGATMVTPWSKRPVVAYVGARDGMLHAIYVSGAPWTSAQGTAQAATLPASTPAGTELWAFLPPGQLCGLATNDAMVDANINVMDVFGDFPTDANGDGVFDLTDPAERPKGIRTWRTILVAAAGEGSSELFALDVTNPLKPALLWRVGGKENHDDRWDLNQNGTFADLGDHMVKTNPATYSLKWFDWDDGDAGTAHIPTDYNTTSATVLDAIKFGRYDYRNMGKTFGTAIGTIWNGRAFRFVAFTATNSADYTNPTAPLGYQGIEVFAVDVVTGQRLWQWQKRYSRKNSAGTVIATNDIPGRPALVDVDNDGSVDRVYVGDLEGHLWELSAVDGRNLNYLASNTGPTVSFPLFGTAAMEGDPLSGLNGLFTPSPGTALAQQPLTSPIGVGRFSQVPAALVPYLKDRIVVAQGTMGVDWSIAPLEKGHVYVAPVYPEPGTRLTPPISVTVTPDPRLYGVLKPEAVWDVVLAKGERVFGMPKIVGNEMFLNTSYGSFTGDLTSSMNDAGATWRVNSSGSTKVDDGQKRFGGVLIFGNDLVVSSDVGIVRKAGQGKTATEATKVRDRFTPTSTKSWEQLPDGTLP